MFWGTKLGLLLGLVTLIACTETRRGLPSLDSGPVDSGPNSDARLDRPQLLEGSVDADFEVCETLRSFGDAVDTAVYFQLDTSRSMNCLVGGGPCASGGDPTSNPNDSRWDAVRNALGVGLSALPLSSQVALFHYPGERQSCPSDSPLVPSDRLANNRSAVESALMSIDPNGFTPTHDAVAAALNALSARTEANRILVLATDGAATVCLGCDTDCDVGQDNVALEARILAARQNGIRTFVIGIPGSDTYRSVLARLAQAGGTAAPGCTNSGPTACHFDLTGAGTSLESAFAEAITTIGQSVLPCIYTVPTNAGQFDPALVNVQLEMNGAIITIPKDPDEANGWNYVNGDSEIRLFGSACEAAEATLGGSITFSFGCPTILL